MAGGRAGVVKNVKSDNMPLALYLRHEAVFLFIAVLNSDIMLCDALQHIDAFSYVNDAVIKSYTVDSGVVIFRAISVPPELCCHIVFVSQSQVLTSLKVIY